MVSMLIGNWWMRLIEADTDVLVLRNRRTLSSILLFVSLRKDRCP